MEPLDLHDLPQSTNQDTEQGNPLRSTLEPLSAVPPLHPPTRSCTLQDGVWLTNLGQYWVPQDPVLRGQIIFNVHDHPLGGHLGHKTTLTNIKKTFFWPGLDRQLGEYYK
ncbi:hypothetical protein AX16_010277, partial [Volvariella volvacea WC 439]